VIACAGPARAAQTIREALAKGADREIHIVDANFAPLDPLGSAKTLAAAIQKEKADLVLTGLQSDDHGFGQSLGACRPHEVLAQHLEHSGAVS
jgi:electron transfer flavoprotein beta subunit